jgi:hypothetical protein
MLRPVHPVGSRQSFLSFEGGYSRRSGSAWLGGSQKDRLPSRSRGMVKAIDSRFEGQRVP